MRLCSCSVVLFLGISLLYGPRAGLCVVTADVVPESGSVIGGVVGTQNISLYCDFRNDDTRLATLWFLQTAEDRGAGRDRGQIPNPHDKFILSGDVVTESNFSVNLNTNLTVLSLTDELDDAIISCVAGVGMSGSADFTLRIYRPPRLSDRGEVTKRENVELSLDMIEPDSLPAFPFPSEFMWRRQDGVELVNTSDIRVFGYPSIFIHAVLQSDTGHYTLTATNYQLDGVTPLGSGSASFSLNVLFGAGLGGAGTETVPVLEGDSATLVCGTDLTGNPMPLITWKDNNDSEVSAGGRYTLSSGTDAVSLTLDSTVRTDDGIWNCTAQVYENGTGSARVGGPVQRTVQLEVVVAPSAPSSPLSEQIGSTWVFFSWFQDPSNRGIPPLSRHVILVRGGEERNVAVEDSVAAANVTGLLPGTGYMFRVVAVSVFGDVQAPSPPSSTLSITTATSAPAPVCSETPRVDDDRLVVTWTYTHTGGMPVTSADVFFNPDTSPEKRKAFSSVPGAVLEDVGSEEREDSIPLPEAGLRYQFTVRAENGIGATEVACPDLTLIIGIPARPDPPTVDSSGDPVIVMATTQHSGVRDSAVDDFQFILKISNVDDQSQDPIQRSKSMDCPAGGQQCSVSVPLTSDGGILEGVKYIVNVKALNRYGQSEVSGNSDVFSIGGDSRGGGEDDTSSSGNSIGAIVGGVIGALVVVVLLGLIFLAIFVLFKKRNGPSYSIKGSGQGVRVEEVAVDLGRELNGSVTDPNKELHYADLELFRKPNKSPKESGHLNNATVDEPVQYATLKEVNPKMMKPSTSSAGEEGGGGVGEEIKEGEREKEMEGDKAQTSSTFV